MACSIVLTSNYPRRTIAPGPWHSTNKWCNDHWQASGAEGHPKKLRAYLAGGAGHIFKNVRDMRIWEIHLRARCLMTDVHWPHPNKWSIYIILSIHMFNTHLFFTYYNKTKDQTPQTWIFFKKKQKNKKKPFLHILSIHIFKRRPAAVLSVK